MAGVFISYRRSDTAPYASRLKAHLDTAFGAEFVFMDTLWPDVDRRTLWDAVEIYAQRDRRYGGAIDAAPAAGGQAS